MTSVCVRNGGWRYAVLSKQCRFLLVLLCNTLLWHSVALAADSVVLEDVEARPLTRNTMLMPQVYPGEVLELNYPKTQAMMPKFYYGSQPLVAFDNQQYWRVLVGIGLGAIPGRHIVTVIEADNTNNKIDFSITPSRKKLLGNKARKTRKTLINRLQTNKKSKHDAFRLPELPWANLTPQLPLAYPAKGEWSQGFGDLFVSDDRLAAVNALQLTTTQAQVVVAPSAAICVQIMEVDKRYSVWLDHGMGLFSYISGLKTIAIEEQDKIAAGSMISQITDEAANEPSVLQWRVVLNNSLINPHSITALKGELQGELSSNELSELSTELSEASKLPKLPAETARSNQLP